MPIQPTEFDAETIREMDNKIHSFLDDLLGAVPLSDRGRRSRQMHTRVLPEVFARLEQIANMHPGFEGSPQQLVNELIEGFVRGYIPCPYCKHPYPLEVEKAGTR